MNGGRMRIAVLLALLVFVPIAALAAEPRTPYPYSMIDVDCADASDSPSPTTAPAGIYAQTAGSADGLCDADFRIQRGDAITADTTFGPCGPIAGSCTQPFVPTGGAEGVYVTVDTDTNTGNWGPCLYELTPWDVAGKKLIACATGVGTATEGIFYFGDSGLAVVTGQGITQAIQVPLPRSGFFVELNISTAWTGSMGMDWSQ